MMIHYLIGACCFVLGACIGALILGLVNAGRKADKQEDEITRILEGDEDR
jgi:hypothetical protein